MLGKMNESVKQRRFLAKEIDPWIGHPVCIAANDGSVYVGILQKKKGSNVFIQGMKLDKKQAEVQGLLGSLLGGSFSGFPGTGEANPLAGWFNGGGLGRGESRSGLFRIGLGAMQFLMPLLSRFFL